MTRLSVLVVEDGNQQREILKSAVERLGDYELDTTRSAADACQAAASLSPELVIIDLSTQPVRDSLDAGSQIGSLGIPVIYLNGDPGDRPLFSIQGDQHAYLSEPVSAETLAAAVELALQKRSLHKQMQERSLRYSAVLELLPGGLGLFDSHSRLLLEANEAFLNLFQLKNGRASETSLADLLAPLEGTLDKALSAAAQSGRWAGRCQIQGIDRPGLSCRVRIHPVSPGGSGSPWMVYCEPGGEKVFVGEKAVEVIERHRQEAETLRDMTATLTQTLELDEVLNRILSQLNKVIPYDGFSIMLWENNQLTMLVNDGAEMLREVLDVVTLPNIQHVIENKQTLILPDTTKDSRWLLFPGYEYIRCWMGVPLIVDDRVVGLLNLDKKEVGFYAENDARLAMAFANQAAVALENARLHERTQRSLKRLSALRTIDNAISSSLDLRFTLDVILNQVISNLGVDATDVLLFNERNQTLNYAAGRGFHTGALRHTHIHLGEGYAGQAALQRRILAIHDLSQPDSSFPHSLLTAAEGFCVYYAAPLVAKGQLKGVLEIFNRSPMNPDQDWLDFLGALALQAGIAVDNVRLFEDLQHANLELTLSYDITLEGWANALEMRDSELEGHTRRVTELTERLARQMGFPDEEIGHLRRGAILHDIGKMGIPDSILTKPGALTEAELKILQMHPVYAYEWLSPIAFLKDALDIPYCHHENWDGSGYPRGLKGDEIPLSARIFVVVHTWDKLSTGSRYRHALSAAEACKHIRLLAGTQFDPRVVEAFLALIS